MTALVPDHTSPVRTSTVAGAPLRRAFGMRTWLRTLHLLADLPLGVVASAVAVTAVSLSAGLALTLVGVPLLVLTLVTARSYGRFERARVRLLLGVELPAPASRGGGLAPRRWLKELGDPAGWKALLHAVAALPLGIATGTVVLAGWAIALTLLATPFSWLWLPSSSHVGPLRLHTPVGTAAAFVAGVLLTAGMPVVVRGLAAVDVAIGRLLLTERR